MASRLVVLAPAAAVFLTAAGFWLYTAIGRSGPAGGVETAPYRLQTTEGRAFTPADLSGKPSALFFGFTHCPDVCPTTLAEMASWYEALGEEARDLRAYFVTVDPERDTPDVLAGYLAWTGRVVGLTGTPEEVAKAARAWGVRSEKVPLEGGGYTMDHTASVLLLDRRGELNGTIRYGESREAALAKLRSLLAS